MNTILRNIIGQLQSVQTGFNWTGRSFAQLLEAIPEEKFFCRPLDDLHSIAEIYAHLTLWRQEAILKIETGKGSKTDDCEENWPRLQHLKSKGWKAIQQEHDRAMEGLIGLLQERKDRWLLDTYYDTDFKKRCTYQFLIEGMLQHDLYHLGQLGLIVKFLQLEK